MKIKKTNPPDYFNYELPELERYFRPSNLPIMNDRQIKIDFLNDYYNVDPAEIKIPLYLLKNPEDSLKNYFSILREGANPVEGKAAGCGTLGNAKLPYPIAYNFLSKDYRNKLNYNDYLKTFENILHINLIKLKEVPVYGTPENSKRYFVEIETIQGSDADVAYFAYYYGFIDMINEGGDYRISNLDFYGENYLCAPYHGWNYIAETAVDIKYGDWCSFIQERYPTLQKGYQKYIYFKGTDGKDYLIVFFQLTNGLDIQIAQYVKEDNSEWQLIQFDPADCIEHSASSTLHPQ